MARIICQAIINDPEDLREVVKKLKKLRVKTQIYRDFIYVDYSNRKPEKIQAVREVFSKINCSEIEQID